MNEREFNDTLGAFLRSERKKHNLTLVEMAQKLHISKSAVSYYENGRGVPVYVLVEYARFFGYSIDDIFNRLHV